MTSTLAGRSGTRAADPGGPGAATNKAPSWVSTWSAPTRLMLVADNRAAQQPSG
jgi:hypothetical protein